MLHKQFTQEEVTEILRHFHALESIFKEHGYETLRLETEDVEVDFTVEQELGHDRD